jgi:hypothetical protein
MNVLSLDIAKRLQSFQQTVPEGVLRRRIIISAYRWIEKSYLGQVLWLRSAPREYKADRMLAAIW